MDDTLGQLVTNLIVALVMLAQIFFLCRWLSFGFHSSYHMLIMRRVKTPGEGREGGELDARVADIEPSFYSHWEKNCSFRHLTKVTLPMYKDNDA